MAPSETHELAPLASHSESANGFYQNHDARISKHSIDDRNDDDEASDDDNEHAGAGAALLGGHMRSDSGANHVVSQPQGASQVIKGIISEVRIFIDVAQMQIWAELCNAWMPRQLPHYFLRFSA